MSQSCMESGGSFIVHLFISGSLWSVCLFFVPSCTPLISHDPAVHLVPLVCCVVPRQVNRLPPPPTPTLAADLLMSVFFPLRSPLQSLSPALPTVNQWAEGKTLVAGFISAAACEGDGGEERTLAHLPMIRASEERRSPMHR